MLSIHFDARAQAVYQIQGEPMSGGGADIAPQFDGAAEDGDDGVEAAIAIKISKGSAAVGGEGAFEAAIFDGGELTGGLAKYGVGL